MGQIIVIRRDGGKYALFRKEPLCFVSQASQDTSLMADDGVRLTIKSASLLDFTIGDKILVGGDEYSIRTKVTREILSEDMYSYDVIFYGVMYELMKSQYRNTDASGKSSKSTFDLTYSLSDFIKVITYNVNRDYPGVWVFDEDNCPETEPQTLQFSKQNCLQVLQTTCKAFGYEFRIDQDNGLRTIRIGKFGSVVNPPGGKQFFEWGKGNGLYKLKEQKIDDKSIITRLWIEGGTANIRSDYRDYSDRLQLPYPKRLNQREHTLSDGTVIPALSEYIGIDDENKRYIEDESLRDQIGSIEDTEHYDKIYPHRTGYVTALGSDIYSFVDNTMDFDLNEKDAEGNTRWLIGGVAAKLTFITGRLAGQQFEVKKDGGYNHSTKTFSIIKYTDERGLEIPTTNSEAFRIGEGDKYKLTEINLPESYVDSAEEDLWYAGYDDFKDRKQARAQYNLTFDRSYFLNALPSDSETSVFKCGDYVPIKDERFGLERNIRIQKMSRNLLVDHDYSLTLSDTTTISVQTQTVLDVMDHNIIIDNNQLRDLNKARRSWRTTEDLRNMVYDADGYFDADNIRPNSIETNMLSVGSKSQQFVLVDVILQANVNGVPDRFDATAGVLAHLTITEGEPRLWDMSAASVILPETGGYYVFAKCSKDSNIGVWYVTQEQLKVENDSDPNNYYFQIGIISSLRVDYGFRDFATTYGFSRVNGNTITTGVIRSADGATYLDLDNGEFAGKINFKDGLVSGDIGIGNANDIKAGMSGAGSGSNGANQDTDIRIWVGASKENKNNAPYRVLHNGKHISTDAEITGKITATSGSIGGFELASNRIGVLQDSNGLTIAPSLTKYSDSSCWTGIGTNVFSATTGMQCVARHEVSNDYNGVALYTKAQFPNDGMDSWHIRRSHWNEGNVFSVGGHCHWDDSYIGAAATNILELYVGITNQFIFSSIPGAIFIVNLPTKTKIQNYTSKNVSFLLYITIPIGVANRIRLTSQPGGQLYSNDGVAVSYVEMAVGDTIVLRYYDGGWYQVSYKTV